MSQNGSIAMQDKEMLEDVLTSQKQITGLYNTYANECATTAIRDEMMNILHERARHPGGYLHGNAEAGLVSHPHGGGTENPEHQAEIPEHDRPELRKREGIAGFGGFPLVLLQNLSAARGKAPLSAFAFGSEQCANQKPSYQETNGGRGIPLNGQRDKRRKKKTSPARLAASVGISPFSARASHRLITWL